MLDLKELAFTAEDWKPIAGYEGLYEVSKSGQVRSLDREVSRKDGQTRKIKGKMLVGSSAGGYRLMRLSRDNKPVMRLVHRIVIETFATTKRTGLEVNHINGNKRDNRLENLEWVTRGDNLRHAFKLGLMKNQSGENGPGAKLTQGDVDRIRNLAAMRVSSRLLAEKFGVHRATISKILRREKWKHI